MENRDAKGEQEKCRALPVDVKEGGRGSPEALPMIARIEALEFAGRNNATVHSSIEARLQRLESLNPEQE